MQACCEVAAAASCMLPIRSSSQPRPLKLHRPAPAHATGSRLVKALLGVVLAATWGDLVKGAPPLPCPRGLTCLAAQRSPTAQATANPTQGWCAHYLTPATVLNPGLMTDEQGMYLIMNSFVIVPLMALDITVQMRFIRLFIVACWNAVTPWHPTAQPADYAPGYGLPVPKFTFIANVTNVTQVTYDRNVAMGYAFHRVVQLVVPSAAVGTGNVLTQMGFDPAYTGYSNLTNPADIGNAVAFSILADQAKDGWNQQGTDRYKKQGAGAVPDPRFGDDLFPMPYFDWTGYVPVNDGYSIRDIRRWQPLVETNGIGDYYVQALVTPQCGWTKPWSITADEIVHNFTLAEGPWPKAMDTPAALADYKKEADAVIQASANLTDEWKMWAEHFDFKPLAFSANLYGPYRKLFGWDITQSLAYDMIVPAFTDALLVAWRNKVIYDTIRPVSAVRYLYGTRNITAYRGRNKGTGTIPGREFSSYLRTMPHSDYPSGTACICSAFAEFNALFIGSDVFNYTKVYGPGCSLREPGVTPRNATTLFLRTKAEFIHTCAYSRLYAGVHFPKAIAAAIEVCAGVGVAGYQKVMNLLQGTQGVLYPPKAWAS